MSIKFEETNFGEVIINGQKYSDVLVVDDRIISRDGELLNKLFGTFHRIADEEINQIIEDRPDIVIIGTGQTGALQVTEDVKIKLEDSGTKIEIYETPIAVKKFNEEKNLGKKVNALIHTTC